MVHLIIPIKCSKGHTLPISFDRNECGCHHGGKPCIRITCDECFKEWIEKRKKSGNVVDYDIDFCQITIPLDEDGVKVIDELLSTKKEKER